MKMLSRFILLLAVLVLTSCGGSKQTLHLYNWADYIDPDMISKFEQDNNCNVLEDTFDSNEAMYAKLKAGATGYDVIFPSSYMVKVMHEQDMLMDLDHTQLPNLQNLDPGFKNVIYDSTYIASVPYALTITGFAYLDNRVENVEPSWAAFENSALAGRTTLLNDMRETIGAALKYLGYSLNTTDPDQLEEAKQVVLKWKQNIAKFENEQYKTGLASEEFFLVHGYSGDIMQVMEENENIVFVVPQEGCSITMDEMVISQDAPNPELAHKFINFILDAEVAAKNIEWVAYLFPNQAAYPLLDEELREDPILFPADEAKVNFEVIWDLGEDNALYSKIWDEIKAAK